MLSNWDVILTIAHSYHLVIAKWAFQTFFFERSSYEACVIIQYENRFCNRKQEILTKLSGKLKRWRLQKSIAGKLQFNSRHSRIQTLIKFRIPGQPDANSSLLLVLVQKVNQVTIQIDLGQLFIPDQDLTTGNLVLMDCVFRAGIPTEYPSVGSILKTLMFNL